MLNTTVELITPARAAEFLKHNISNRPLRSRHIQELMRDMKAGNWRLTHQGIAFDVKGNLVDGQHRLTAVVLSGVTIESMITREMETESVRVVDNAATRSYRDSLLFAGASISAANHNLRAQSAFRTIVRFGYDRLLHLTNYQLDELFGAYDTQIDAFIRISGGRKRGCGACVDGAILCALMHGEDEESLNAFVDIFLYGNAKNAGDMNAAAPFKLAHFMLQEREKGGGANREKEFNVAQNAIYKFLHGEDVTALRETKYLRYPVSTKLDEILGGIKYAE